MRRVIEILLRSNASQFIACELLHPEHLCRILLLRWDKVDRKAIADYFARYRVMTGK